MQFGDVIELIQEHYCNGEAEEAYCYHSMILSYLLRLISSIPPEQKEKRICKKSDLDIIIKNNKSCIFYSAYPEFLGQEKRKRFLRKKYFSENNTDDFERIVIVEVYDLISYSDIKDIVLSIKDRFFKAYKRAIKSGAPYIYLRNHNGKLKTLKEDLLRADLVFKDGFCFENADFNVKVITEKSTLENNICLKFINYEEHIEEILKEISKTKEIYQFFFSKPIEINHDVKHIKMQIEQLSDIKEII